MQNLDVVFSDDWIIVLFFILGALLHGITGFGYPIVGTAIIASFYPLKVAVAMVVVPCVVLNLMMLRSGGTIIDNITQYGKEYFWLFFTSFLGGLLGVQFLLVVPESYLKIFLAITLLFYVYTQYSRHRIYFTHDNKTMAIFGFIAGVVGGATNAIVAFLMIYLLGTKRNKNEMVIVNNLSILITKIIQIFVLFPVITTFDSKQKWLLLTVIVISLFFVYFGSQIRHRLPQTVFNHMIAVMLFCLGLYALCQGVHALGST